MFDFWVGLPRWVRAGIALAVLAYPAFLLNVALGLGDRRHVAPARTAPVPRASPRKAAADEPLFSQVVSRVRLPKART